MRYGISWNLDSTKFASAEEKYRAIMQDIKDADIGAINSIWIEESRDDAYGITSPSIFLTHIAPQTKSVRLGVKNRQLSHSHPVRCAEEFAQLDLFSKGRAAIAFESASKQGLDAAQLHETIEFLQSAWARDNFRFNGDYIKFPASVPEDAAKGFSAQLPVDKFVHQWLRNNALEEYMSVRPKPYVIRPLIHVSIEDDATLHWAAKRGISPIVYAETPTEEAIERIARYTRELEQAGRSLNEVEIIVEREINIDGESGENALGGSTEELATAIRKLGDKTQMAHLIWKRKDLGPEQLKSFVSGIMMGIQA